MGIIDIFSYNVFLIEMFYLNNFKKYFIYNIYIIYLKYMEYNVLGY